MDVTERWTGIASIIMSIVIIQLWSSTLCYTYPQIPDPRCTRCSRSRVLLTLPVLVMSAIYIIINPLLHALLTIYYWLFLIVYAEVLCSLLTFLAAAVIQKQRIVVMTACNYSTSNCNCMLSMTTCSYWTWCDIWD